MKKLFKTLEITALVTAIGTLMGCYFLVADAGIEIDGYGGKSMDNAYHLTEGEWTISYISSSNPSRWYSIPVTKGNGIDIWKKDHGKGTVYVIYDETGTKLAGPWILGSDFMPATTGKLYIEVLPSWEEDTPLFAIAYTNGVLLSSKPAHWWD
jgi:hypothetical protein